MRFNKLDLNLLVALDALLSAKNISRAADKIHLSQSAMSNALARLRDYFGDELLVQVGRNMELTARAEGLVDAVRDVLVRIEATVEARPLFVPGESTRAFRLLISDYSLMTLMPKVTERAYAEAPGVRLEFVPQVAHPQRILERGEADVLIIPREYCSADHPFEILFEETYCALIWKDSPLARRELSQEAYVGAGHVVIQPGDGQPALDDWLIQRLGIARRVDVRTFTFLSPAYLLPGTNRIATVHRRLAQQVLNSQPVVMREVPFQMPVMEQAMQWHTHRTTDPGITWLRQLLHECSSALGAEQ
ncbi:LysR family transcriptional regulator [Paraburkholderia strydomiana]|uniref:LysR family transcriptional regulator n=1 Tax=Paraburkholderia strydomiana TaxID=1245417 RepID=UPI0038BDF025